MENFVRKFFDVETIEEAMIDNLYPTLEILEDDYLNLLARNYDIDVGLPRNKMIDALYPTITSQFKQRLLNFTQSEHKSFNDFYNGMVDYSDENVYLNLKKFTGLGYIFLFTTNGGKLYNFKMSDEILEIYEELLRTC